MKAISLWQPWASLWLTDSKVHETRHWSTPHRGWLAVHATKHIETEVWGAMEDICCRCFGKSWRAQLPTGAIIGAVDLVGVVRMPTAKPAHADDFQCGNWEGGRFAWKRAAIVKLNDPILYRGRQSMFTLPDEITRLILPSQAPDLVGSMGHHP
jgi:activating signal cointegrator 1